MLDHSAVNAAIRAALDATSGTDEPRSPQTTYDIAFHMTDWLRDLESFHQFCSSPSAYTPEQIQCVLYDFLCHVPNHVAAAAKLLADHPVSDIFEVGAVECSHSAKSEGDTG